MFFFVFITKNTNVDGILFFNFVYISNFDWKFYVFKINLFGKNLSAFVILGGLRSAGIKYLTKHHLTLFTMEGGGGGHIVPVADSFVCCGSIRDFEKVKFSENS